MGRPLRTDTPATNRVQAMLSSHELEALDDWAFGQRIRSRSEAIRQLIELGLSASRAGWMPEESEGEDGAGGDS